MGICEYRTEKESGIFTAAQFILNFWKQEINVKLWTFNLCRNIGSPELEVTSIKQSNLIDLKWHSFGLNIRRLFKKPIDFEEFQFVRKDNMRTGISFSSEPYVQ